MPKKLLRLRLVLDVAYSQAGVSEAELRRMLENSATHAMNEGLLTGETPAIVDEYRIDVRKLPAEKEKRK